MPDLGLWNFFKKVYLFIYRQREREGERKGEKHQSMVASHMAPPGTRATRPPQHVPLLGIEPATPAWAGLCILYIYIYIYIVF